MNKFEIVVKVEGKDVVAELPEVFKTLHEALPLIVEFFGGSQRQVFNAERIHRMVGGAYKYLQWFDKSIERCRLVEGVDYWKVEIDLDDPKNAALVSRDGRARPYQHYFTPFAARKLIAQSNTDEGHALYAYMDAVAEAVTPALVRQYDHLLGEKDTRIKTLLTSVKESESDCQTLAKRLGAPSVDKALEDTYKNQNTAHSVQDYPVQLRKCEMYAEAMKSIAEVSGDKQAVDRILNAVAKIVILADAGEMFSSNWRSWAD